MTPGEVTIALSAGSALLAAFLGILNFVTGR
jgi:hypothetical protein